MANSVTQLNTNLFLWKQDETMANHVNQVCVAWDKLTFASGEKTVLKDNLKCLVKYIQEKFGENYSLYLDTALCLMLEKQGAGESIAKKLMKVLPVQQLTEEQDARKVYIYSVIDNNFENLKDAACKLQDSFAKADFALIHFKELDKKDPRTLEEKLPNFAHDVKQLNDPIGAYKTAFYYMHYQADFWGFERDVNKAADLYEKSAKAGLTMAQYHLAICYYLGEGREQDEVKGGEWMEKAAKWGNRYAQVGLIFAKFLMNKRSSLGEKFGEVFQLFLDQSWSSLNKKLAELWIYANMESSREGIRDEDGKLLLPKGDLAYAMGLVKEINIEYDQATCDYNSARENKCPYAIERFGAVQMPDD